VLAEPVLGGSAWLLLLHRDPRCPLLLLWLQEKEMPSPNDCYVLVAGCPDGALPSSSMLLGFIQR